MSEIGEVTSLLRALDAERTDAPDALLNEAYPRLKDLANSKMVGYPAGHTLQPTDLVHEAYIRMFGKDGASWENSRHFYWAASRAMHDILVERARRHCTKKRGGDRSRVDFDENLVVIEKQARELLATTEALEELRRASPELAEVVMLRFFGGLSHDQVSDILGISSATVRRRWTTARTWLRSQVAEDL